MQYKKAKKRREAEKESKAVRHNQAECRQYLGRRSSRNGERKRNDKIFQQTLTNLRNKH